MYLRLGVWQQAGYDADRLRWQREGQVKGLCQFQQPLMQGIIHVLVPQVIKVIMAQSPILQRGSNFQDAGTDIAAQVTISQKCSWSPTDLNDGVFDRDKHQTSHPQSTAG